MLLAVACGFCGCFIVAETAAGQEFGSQVRENIRVQVDTVEPIDAGGTVLVRRPQEIKAIPPSVMPKRLMTEPDQFTAKVSANVVISEDGKVSDCTPSVPATFKTYWSSPEMPAYAGLAQEACAALIHNGAFQHALAIDGRPIAVRAGVVVFLTRRSAAALPVLLPPPLPPHLTSGTVLAKNGHSIGKSSQWSRATINPPFFTGALTDHRNLPKTARAGALLKLGSLLGRPVVTSCKIAVSSGDSRLDDATCIALKAAGYAGYSFESAEDYPVIVEWRGANAAMRAHPSVEAPHMPKDVILTPSDLPPTKAQASVFLKIDETGKIDGCEIVDSTKNDIYDAASCRIAMERVRVTGALDYFNRPARSIYHAIVDWDKMLIRPFYP
jgi:hypothetical protein